MFKKSIMPMPQLPPIEDISIILEVIKEGWELVKYIFGIGDIVGKSKQTNVDNCEISDLAEINSIFNEFILSIEPKVNEIEESIQDEMYYYLDELIEFISDNNDRLKEKGIRITTIERKIEKIKHNINGNLKKEISKNISLDNYECKQIIKMLPGERKTNKMNEFFELTLNNAIENLIVDIKEDIEEIMDYIEECVFNSIEILNKDIQNQYSVLEKLDNEKIENIEEKEFIIEKSILNILISESAIEILR
ncbi:hypothetical protein [Romboutsia ilealis]|uniref:hypothetical protein n=1 Tax=Romboutsia ilealis TaxID=1115758 RepID=UPI002494D402|nr:hypothetical protein [Romboutsia ilealis]